MWFDAYKKEHFLELVPGTSTTESRGVLYSSSLRGGAPQAATDAEKHAIFVEARVCVERPWQAAGDDSNNSAKKI